MKLSKLISDCNIKFKISSLYDFNINGITNDSRKMKEKFIFVAYEGANFDGHLFIKNFNIFKYFAVISRSETKANNYLKEFQKGITIIETKQPIKLANEMASLIYPNKINEKIAVTGTNGKTSVCDFVRQLWNINGFNSASLGTLGINSKRIRSQSSLTTMDGIDFHKTLNKLYKNGCEKIITEASSIGIDRWRLFPVKFEKLAFTNLSRDHIDYHKTFKNYKNSKLKLFKNFNFSDTLAIINSDDIYSRFFYEECKKHNIKVLDYGHKAKFLKIEEVIFESANAIIKIILNKKRMVVKLKTICKFDILNKFCALLLVKGFNIRKEDFKNLNKLIMPHGRFDKIYDKEFKIYIDYAHTPDALKNIFQSLERVKENCLIALIGCGGERDSGKRNLMTKVALQYCDKVILADDNPRNEEPKKIRRDMVLGIGKKNLNRVYDIGDRKTAINFGINNLKKNDILIITGKGHEQYQIIGNNKVNFSDYKTVKKLLG